MRKHQAECSRQGFTLVEIMAALAIAVILMVLIAQITNQASVAIRLGNQTIDAVTQGRLALDRIGLDLGSLVTRSDVDFVAGNPAQRNNNFQLLFLTAVPAAGSPTGGNRDVSMVGYRIAPHPDNANLPCLLRAGMAVGWTDSTPGFIGLKSNGLPIQFTDPTYPTALLPATTSTTDFDVLAPGVIRMVVGFQLYPNNNPAILENATSVTNSQGQFVYSPPVRSLVPNDGGSAVNYVDFTHISAIIVGVVVLDTNRLKLLSASQVTTIAQQFAVPASGQLPVQSWAPTVNGLVPSLSASIPLLALQSVHVFQRTYPITLSEAITR